MVVREPGVCEYLSLHNTKLQPEQIEALVAAYVAGIGVAEVARKFGMHEQTAAAHLNRQGVTVRQQLLEGARADQVIAGYQTGLTIGALASQHGVSYDTIRRLLIRAGVHRPGKPRGRHAAS